MCHAAPVTGEPWWHTRVAGLMAPERLQRSTLGALWRLCEGLRFIRDNVDPALLPIDFAHHPGAQERWSDFERRESQALSALEAARAEVNRQVASGALGPVAFRAGWQGLGFQPNPTDAGTPADDYLDALFTRQSAALDAPLPASGNPNLSSRALRIADFLQVLQPTPADVVIDLGSGVGKLALTVAASSHTNVVGVECCAEYVRASQGFAADMNLQHVRFEHTDARDVDLSHGSVFYLFHPFRDAVAQAVAQKLGALARHKDIRIYAAGPLSGCGQFFLEQVEQGALALTQRRGEFSEVMLLESARS